MSRKTLFAAIPFALFLLLVAGFYIATLLNPRDLGSPLIGKPLPAFELESLYEDQPAINSESFKGKVTLFNVFGSWCVACRVEHPYLVELQTTEDVHLVGLDWRDKRPEAKAWLERHGDPYDVVAFDEHSEVAIDLGVTGAPETYLIDPQGIVRVKYVGPLDAKVWRSEFLPEIGKMEMAE